MSALRPARAPGEPRAVGYLYVLPALALYALFLLVPLGQTVWLSLLHWDGLTAATWAGTANYEALLADPSLRAPFLHALTLLLFYAVLPVALGLLLASALSRFRVRGMTFWRTVLFLPQVLAMVVVGVAWRSILGPDGLLNSAPSPAPGWATTRGRCRPSAPSAPGSRRAFA